MMMDAIRWGILGPGSIAKKFATGLTAVLDARLVAVGSRSQERADEFGDVFNVPNRHGSYEALVNAPDVDAIYVSSPHALHKEHTLLCLEAGKAVLCEKPIAINAAQATEMVQVARERGVFLMEAMWSRFFPAMVKLREVLAEGTIGEVRLVTGDFGFRAGVNPEGRLFNPALGGGALLDVGIYPISFASMVMGQQPDTMTCMANIGETGVDEETALVFGYDSGAMAMLHTAVRLTTPQEARVVGTDGFIRLPQHFWRPAEFTVCTFNNDQTVKAPYEGNGYNYEAMEVMECLRSGRTESDVMPLDESIATMETMDRVREQIGLKYPME
jgi:dihydrodiol dehydrogenase / D-xylose 1-dehydrogenase (NADP)